MSAMMSRGAPAVLVASWASGCALLPQDSGEWTIAAIVTGVLLVGAVVGAVVATRRGGK